MSSQPITVLLDSWRNGDTAALDAVTSAVYQELRKIARSRLRSERSDHTLQPTALVHEAYVRLIGHDQQEWRSRAHFYAVAAHIMREILVDHARKRGAQKRSAGEKVEFDEAFAVTPQQDALLLQLSEGLDELAKFDERKARLIELKFFAGLEGKEISEVLGISTSTITRESRLAEAWLQNYLTKA
jgi:RNA polymerase sigma factor (TIGR02999 family)